ncbi:MAG: hypothetical protein KF901_20385 [Myxococcales bacterium]|nr:hypothetical protein [Myxococcales bacterium]
MRWRVLLLLAWGLIVHCGNAEPVARLDVLLLTDYRPGLDFVEVHTEVLDEVEHSRPVDRSESFLAPADIVRFDALPRATRRRVRVHLVDRNGAVLGRSRVVTFRHDRSRQQLTRVCAACADFACPLGQTCECGVTPICVPDECDGEECDVPGCQTNVDCGSSSLECVDSVCREGSCLRAPNDAACGAFEVCDVSVGCVSDPMAIGDGGVEVDSGADSGPDPVFTDRGLIARFFLDEGSGGVVRDATGAIALPLTEDPPGNPALTSADGFGGLRFTATNANGRACVDPSGTPLAGVDGSSTGTLEAVVDLHRFEEQGSRFIHFGAGLEWDFSVGYALSGLVIIGMNDSAMERYFDAELIDRGRSVVTMVFDGRLAPEQRVRAYLDGSRIPERSAEGRGIVPLSIRLAAGTSFCLGNRPIGARSFEGVLHYAAVYAEALTDAEVLDHARQLLIRDDR